MNNLKKTRTLTISALLVAAYLLLDRFTIPITPTLHISVKFAAIALAGCLYGAKIGACVGGLCDVIGYFAYPKGAFFWGFTLSAIIVGVIFGLIAGRKTPSIWRVLLAQILCTIVVDLALNTYWLSLMYGMNAWIAFIGRYAEKLLMLIPMTGLIFLLWKVCNRKNNTQNIR
ncbi:MAG: folate family ECF transporter S component [Clostridiales bacterium]|nr:folate family ECF transporter S component [Clostridiales bacterium]